MKNKIMVKFLLWGLLAEAARLAGQGHAPAPIFEMPGPVGGAQESKWLAPYVNLSSMGITGGEFIRVVRWFAPDGSVVRELRDANPVSQTGLVMTQHDKILTVYATGASWTITLPDVPGTGPALLATRDSSTMVLPLENNGLISAEIYRGGKLAAQIGPYFQYAEQEFMLGEDGSLALLVRKESQSNAPRLLVFAPGGKLSFAADCPGYLRILAVAPDGRGAVVRGRAPKTWRTNGSILCKMDPSTTPAPEQRPAWTIGCPIPPPP